MKTKRITEEEIAPVKVANLPTNPTSARGGSLTPGELKAAFDRLPLLIAERLNSLIDELTSEDLPATIMLGESDLWSFYTRTVSGEVLSDMTLDGSSVAATLRSISDRLEALEEAIRI